MIWVWVIIGFVALQRLAELPHAERNTRALMAKGAVEIGRQDDLRWTIGLRNSGHTVAKLLDPCAPGRALREVYERDKQRFGIRWTSFSTSVVFPVPDGAETMNSRPRLLNILHLLAHLLELRLCVDDQLRDAQSVGFRPDGVHLTVHLLQ